MTFLHAGLAAAAISCVAIPIIIHLLMRRRRKPVMWGAMRFLLEAYRRQRRKLMLEKWLLLAARCLVVLLAGLAIARPLLAGAGSGSGGRTVYLLIDNGLASQAVGDGGKPALARHKELAAKVLAGLGQSAVGGSDPGADRGAVIAMGGPAQALVAPASAEIAGVGRVVEQLEATDSRTDLPGAMALAAAAIESEMARDSAARNRRTFVVLLSDFVEGSADVGGTGAALAKLPPGVKLVCGWPAIAGAGGADNLAISAVDPVRPVLMTGGAGNGGGTENVRVTVRRSGPGVARAGAATFRVRMEHGGGQGLAGGRPITAVARFAAGQEETTTSVQVPFAGSSGASDLAPVGAGPGAAAGGALLVAQLEPAPAGADVIPGDSTCRRPVEVREMLRVGLISPRRFGERAQVDQLDSAEWMRLALRPGEGPSGDSGVEVVEIEPAGVDAARLAGLDAVILPRPDLVTDDGWRRIGAFATGGGGMVVVMPPGGEAGSGVQLWSDKMVRELGLPWTVAREVKTIGGEGGGRVVAGSPPIGEGALADLLGVVRAEAEELLRPVRVSRALPIDIQGPGELGGEKLLALEDGTPVVWAGSAGEKPAGPESTNGSEDRGKDGQTRAAPSGRGLVVYISSAMELSWTNLPARPMMLPLVQEMVRQGVGRARGSWWTIAGRRAQAPGRVMELVPIEPAGAAAHSDPVAERVGVDATGQSVEPMRRAGCWRAVDDRGGVRGLVAVNADWRGGRMGTHERSEIERWLRAGSGADPTWLGNDSGTGEEAIAGAITALFSRGKQGPPISVPLLAGAMALALAEIWLARRASHADVARPGAAPSLGSGGKDAVPA